MYLNTLKLNNTKKQSKVKQGNNTLASLKLTIRQTMQYNTYAKSIRH